MAASRLVGDGFSARRRSMVPDATHVAARSVVAAVARHQHDDEEHDHEQGEDPQHLHPTRCAAGRIGAGGGVIHVRLPVIGGDIVAARRLG